MSVGFRYSPTLCILLLSLILICPVWASPEQELFKQVNLWESRDRLDLARQAVEKLFVISPNNPDALAQLAYIELREHNIDEASLTLEKLIAVAPNHKEIANVKKAIFIETKGKEHLREARLFAKSANTGTGTQEDYLGKAIKAYDELFAGTIPTPQLRYEYWLVVGDSRDDKEWGRALNGIEELVKDYPGSLRYKLALIEHKLSRNPDNMKLIGELIEFTKNPRYNKQANASWRRAVFRLPEKPASIPYYEYYLAHHPDDSSVQLLMKNVLEAQREYEELLKDPAFIAKLDGLKQLEDNHISEAEHSFEFALESRPQDVDAVGGMGIVKLRQGKHNEALEYFKLALQLSTEQDLYTISKWGALKKTARFWGLLAKADTQLAQGEYLKAKQSVFQAMEIDEHPNADAKLASIFIAEKKVAEGQNIYRQALLKYPKNSFLLKGLIASYLQQGQYDEARKVINEFSLEDEYEDEYAVLEAQTLKAEAEKYLEIEDLEGALQRLSRAYELDPDDEWLLLRLARVHGQVGNKEQEKALYQTGVKRFPKNSSLLKGLISTYISGDDIEGARSVIDSLSVEQKQLVLGTDYAYYQSQILTAESERLMKSGDIKKAADKYEQAVTFSPNDPWLIFGLYKLYDQLGLDLKKIDDLFKTAIENTEDQDEIRYAYSLYLISIDETDSAIATLQQISPQYKNEDIPNSLDELIAQRSGSAAGAFDFVSRDASDGKSSLATTQVPLHLRLPSIKNGHTFIHIEPVTLDPGSLSTANQSEINDFGLGLFCSNDCAGDDIEQQDKGIAFAIGYENKNARIDIGTTPLGFEVQDIVGGIKYGSNISQFYWGVDLSRRPMVGTLLSYAGTKDIYSGESWGGVRTNGVTFSLGHDKGGAFGFWSNLDLDYITGKNVADNSRFRIMAGSYWRLINEEENQFSIGLNAGLWRYDKSLDEFTYGQGGYYSPNRYESLSVPVDLSGRITSSFSYRLRASISYSWDYEETTPFYPNDIVPQRMAEAMSSQTGIDPYFEGGSGSGSGYSLLGAVEYKLNRNMFLGATVSTDQSDYYKPIRAAIYLRHVFGKNDRAATVPPVSINPYSSY